MRTPILACLHNSIAAKHCAMCKSKTHKTPHTQQQPSTEHQHCVNHIYIQSVHVSTERLVLVLGCWHRRHAAPALPAPSAYTSRDVSVERENQSRTASRAVELRCCALCAVLCRLTTRTLNGLRAQRILLFIVPKPTDTVLENAVIQEHHSDFLVCVRA